MGLSKPNPLCARDNRLMPRSSVLSQRKNYYKPWRAHKVSRGITNYQHKGAIDKPTHTRTHNPLFIRYAHQDSENAGEACSSAFIRSSYHLSARKVISWSFLYDRREVMEAQAPWHRGFFSFDGVSLPPFLFCFLVRP
jgi:hypothetical protein